MFSNNHQCTYIKTISRLRRREYRHIEIIIKKKKTKQKEQYDNNDQWSH